MALHGTISMSLLVVISLTVATVCATPRPGTNQYEKGRDSTDGYLPRVAVPIHYDVEITTDIYQPQPPFTFSGYESIVINCTVETNILVLNSLNLRIIGIRVFNDPSNVVRPPSPILLQWSLEPQANFLVLELANALRVGFTYIVDIYFDGVMNPETSTYGLRWLSYTDDDGSTKYVAATQFQGIAARQMFPCFDEPDLKATFNITVVAKPESVVLSNMPLVSTEDAKNGWVYNIFAKSPVMSTYQVTIAVGDFTYIETEWQGITSCPVRIYGRRQKMEKLAFAAYAAPRIQAWFERETGIPNQLPKMDHIALPVQTWAMENWGLITYSENWLSIDNVLSSAASIQSTAEVIAHELAHQWYGNLITFKTFSEAWLNEGFATYYGYTALEALGWPGSEIHHYSGTQPFLETDQLNTSVPIRKKQDSIFQADVMAAGSTYPKGAAMVRQLRGILTLPTLNRGLSKYLTKYSYGAVITDDLWSELEAQAAIDGITNPDGSAINLGVLMNAWLDQFGYPVLNVTRNGDGTATVTSRQYFNPVSQTADVPSDYGYSWSIPITVGTRATIGSEPTPPGFWIPFGSSSATLTGIPTTAGDWFMINVKQLAFYRVQYDSSSHRDIVNQLITDYTVIPSESRAQFVDDSFALSRTAYIPATRAMDTTQYLDKEVVYIAWGVALKHLRYFDRFIQPLLWYSNYGTYMLSKIQPVYERLGWNYVAMENPQTQYLRRDAISNACYYGLADCRDYAQLLYDAYKVNPDVNSVNINNLPTVLCEGVNSGDSSDWAMVFQQYQNRVSSTVSEERNAYLYAMACTTDTVWLDRYLNYIIRGELIAARDQNTGLSYMIQNRIGRPIVWDYFTNSWNTVPATISKVARLRQIVLTFATEDGVNMYNDFVTQYPPSSGNVAAYREMEQLLLQNVEWLSSNENDLQGWLIDRLPPKSAVNAKTMSQLPISPMDD